ncbi:MAG: hypothetical protein AAF581_19075 [Planctomycetota bacterium]
MMWKTVYTGPMARVLALQATLEGNGFTTYVPDQNMKTIYPFYTGLNCLDVQLQVPDVDVERAAEAVLELHVDEGDSTTGVNGAPDAESADTIPEHTELRRFGIRACFAALLFSPLGLLLASMYLLDARVYTPRPKAHWAVVFAWWVALLGTLGWGFFLFAR